MSLSRRAVLHHLALAPAALLAHLLRPPPADAAMYTSGTTPSYTSSGDPKKLSTYMPQIEAGYQTLVSLRDNWEEKTAAYDGDVIRRELGTVGVKSPLFNLRKAVFKAWQIVAETSQDDQYVERLEGEWNDVISGISAVDYQLYSVGFTELLETKDSLIRQGRVSLDELIKTYGSMLDDFKASL